MSTNLAIDDGLIIQAQKIGYHKTKKETVTVALKEYIAHKEQIKTINFFGKIDFDNDYDYKSERKR